MDVLVISAEPPYPLRNDERRLVYCLSRELSKQHHFLDLLSFYQEPEDMAQVPRYEHFFRSVQLIADPKPSLGALQQRIKRPALRFPNTIEGAWSPEMWQAVRRNTENRNYDLIFLSGGYRVYEYHYLIKATPNLFMVPHLHSLDYRRRLEHGSKRQHHRSAQRDYKIAAAYETWMYDNFHATAVTTQTQVKFLEKQSMAQPVMLPLGVDVDYFVPTGYEPRSPGLLFIGDFDHPLYARAALRLCETIFPMVRQVVPQVTLYLVGPNPSPKLYTFASDSIIITGYVPDLRPHYDLATIYVSPLQYEAGFQQNILHAMAMMTPVVATPVSCEGLNFQPEHEIAIANSDVEIAQKVVALLQDPDRRKQLQNNGRSRVQNSYAWDLVASRYIELF